MIEGYLKILVLSSLENESLSGYSLINKISAVVKDKPSPGSIYPLLHDLLNKKYISCKEEGNKKVYSITRKGILILKKIIKEKEKIILNHIKMHEIINMLHSDESSRFSGRLIKKIEENDYNTMNRIMEIMEIMDIAKFKHTILRLILSEDYEKKKLKVNKVMTETVSKLCKLID